MFRPAPLNIRRSPFQIRNVAAPLVTRSMPASAVVTWDPLFAVGSAVLSNQLLTVEVNSGNVDGARTTSPATGKFTVEYHIDLLGAFCCLGVGDASALLFTNQFIGNGGNDHGIMQAQDGTLFHSGGSTTGIALAGGDVINLYIDQPNNLFYIAKNGVNQLSGDPVAGTGGISFNSSGPLYAIFQAQSGDTIVTARLTGASQAYPRTGFAPFDTTAPATAVTYNDNLTETATPADSVDPSGSTFGVPLSEATTPAESETAAQTFPNTLSETTTPGESETVVLTTAPADTEAVTAAESEATTQTMGSTDTEAATASETETGGLVFTGSETEAATPAESETTAQTFAPSDSEAATADASTTDSYIHPGTTYNDNLTEAATASESETATVDSSPTQTEAATPDDQVAASVIQSDADVEAATAAATLAAGITENVSITESATPSDALEDELATSFIILVDVNLRLGDRFPAVHIPGADENTSPEIAVDDPSPAVHNARYA